MRENFCYYDSKDVWFKRYFYTIAKNLELPEFTYKRLKDIGSKTIDVFPVSIRYTVLWTFQKWKFCYKMNILV